MPYIKLQLHAMIMKVLDGPATAQHDIKTQLPHAQPAFWA